MRTRTTTAVVVVLLGGAGMTATAGAAAAAPTAPTHPTPFSVAADGSVQRDDASSIAGYGADLSHYTSPTQWKASATFVVPAVQCTRKTTNVLFVELFFDGTAKAGNGLGEGGYAVAGCDGTTPDYSLNVSADGGVSGGVDVATAAGDTVTVSFAADRTAETSTITDVTTGASGSQTGTGFTSVGGMQISVQGGDAHSVFPAFKKVHFSDVTGAGQKLQALNPGSFDATDDAGTIKILTGPIDTTGKGFLSQFVANFTPSPTP